jgi:hypothetical protein
VVVPPLRARALARAQFSVSQPVSVRWSSVRRSSSPAGACCDAPLYMLVSLARALACARSAARGPAVCTGWCCASTHHIYAIAVYQPRSFQAATDAGGWSQALWGYRFSRSYRGVRIFRSVGTKSCTRQFSSTSPNPRPYKPPRVNQVLQRSPRVMHTDHGCCSLRCPTGRRLVASSSGGFGRSHLADASPTCRGGHNRRWPQQARPWLSKMGVSLLRSEVGPGRADAGAQITGIRGFARVHSTTKRVVFPAEGRKIDLLPHEVQVYRRSQQVL